MTKAEEAALKAYPVHKGASKEWIKHHLSDGDCACFIKGYEQAEKDLGWISVKDRLPKESHFVLTCVVDTGTPQCVGMALLLKDGTWWDGDIKVRVDYWMEVPKLKK